MPTKLSKAAESINDFLFEADECAASDLGFASMFCIFAVIEAMSEALEGRSSKTLDLFTRFVKEMGDTSSWLRVPDSISSTYEHVASVLANIRHALVHQLSIPKDVILVDSMSNASKLAQANSDLHILGIYEFVDAVRDTAYSIIQAHPDAILDPDPGSRRRGTVMTYVVEEPE